MAIRTLDRYINYIKQNVEKIFTDPSISKKTLQFSGKLMTAYDLYTGKEHALILRNHMKGTVNILEFYGSFKNVVFWMNPFSKKSMDQELLAKTLEIALLAHPYFQDQEGKELGQKVAKAVVIEVMDQKDFVDQQEVRDIIIESLQQYRFDEVDAARIAAAVKIQNQSRSPIELLSMVCFTIGDLADNILTLQKWGMVELSSLAAEMGQRSPILTIVIKVGAERVIGILAVSGLTLLFSDATFRAGKAFYYVIVNRPKGINVPPDKDQEENRSKAVQELKGALFDMAKIGIDLGATAVPLFFTLNPAVALGLGIFSKGTGLICALAR